MVEWKKLGEVCTFNRGRTITAKNAIDGNIPVIAGGQTPSYYHNEPNRDGESITVAGSGAYAGYISYWNQPIFVSDAFTVDPTTLLKHKYLFYWLKYNQAKVFATQKGAGVPHVHGKDIANFLIPIPSLDEQNRIVGILDTFTASIDNLKEQIAQRRKQYEYYRDQLLDLEGKEGVEMKTLGEILQVKKGDYITKKEAKEGIFPVILGGKEPAYFIDRYNHTGKAIVISRSGASAGYVSFWDEPIFVTDGFLIEPKDNVSIEYLYYLLKSKQRELHGAQKGGAIPHVTPAIIEAIDTALPDKLTQQRIVSILDTFEASIQNLEAQLSQREKQYEYYRNKLLTFE